jgi:hypothetical protein
VGNLQTIIKSIVGGQFLRDKIRETAEFFGEHSFIETMHDLPGADIILLDLEHPQALDILRDYGQKVIAFGPHTKQDLVKISRNFGAQAYSRSEFSDSLHMILSSRI